MFVRVLDNCRTIQHSSGLRAKISKFISTRV